MNNQRKMVPTVLLERISKDSTVSMAQLDQIRQILEAPVPPAGDVEVLGYAIKDYPYSLRHSRAELNKLTIPFSDNQIVELVDRDHVTRLNAELNQLITDCWQACGGNGPASHDDLLTVLRLMNEAEDELSAERDRLLADLRVMTAARNSLRSQVNVLEVSEKELNQEANGLQSECGRLKSRSDKHWRALIDMRDERDALQSELTKARELLRRMTTNYACCLEAGHDRITFLGGDCDSVEKMLDDSRYYAEACAFLARQSATAAQGDWCPDCSFGKIKQHEQGEWRCGSCDFTAPENDGGLDE